MKTPLVFSGLFLWMLTFTAWGQDDSQWPKTIPFPNGKVSIYQPQYDSLIGNKLYSRAAVSVSPRDKDPVFGAIWVTSMISTDRETRLISLDSVAVTDVRFPVDVPDDKLRSFKSLLESEIPKWRFRATIDQLVSTLDQQEKRVRQDTFRNDPPEIIFTQAPSILVLFDGAPVYKPIENSPVKRAVNTPFMIFQDPSNHQIYLYGNSLWFTTNDAVKGTWKQTEKLPAEIAKLQKPIDEAAKKQQAGTVSSTASAPSTNVIPKIIVSTTPAELLQSNGEPQYSPIEGTGLLYMTNTNNSIFRSTNKTILYVLISGRWYTAASLSGPWTYLPPENLPPDFAHIPEGSPADVVLASVPGTPAAREAVMDAQIPQTAAVDRKTAKCEVKYDGDPEFVPIQGTPLFRAENTESTVIKSGQNTYYVCDNAVWFIGKSPNGPWEVATEIPKDIQNIPPEDPSYNVKYVYIYESTPSVVYIGYLPGYVGCYIAGPVVIYGTGFLYPCWVGPYYYPHPVTFGFSMHFNPWTGWSFGFSMSFGGPVGWFTIGFGGPMFPGGWWGPPVFRPPFYPPVSHFYGPRPATYRNTNITINNNYYNNNNLYNGKRQGVNTGTEKTHPASKQTGLSQKQAVSKSSGQTKTAQTKNNVMTDKSGNVYRKTGSTWEQNTGRNNWQPAERQPSGGGQQPTGRSSGSSFDRNQMNQQMQSRERGMQRDLNRSSFSTGMRSRGRR